MQRQTTFYVTGTNNPEAFVYQGSDTKVAKFIYAGLKAGHKFINQQVVMYDAYRDAKVFFNPIEFMIKEVDKTPAYIVDTW